MPKKIIKKPVSRPVGSPGLFKKEAKSPASARGQTVTTKQMPEPVPAELAGKYAVWTPDGLRLVGHGSSMTEALAIASVEDGRLVQRIPKTLRARSLGGPEPSKIEA